MHKGRVVFGAMDEVVFGHPAAEAIVAQMDRLGAARWAARDAVPAPAAWLVPGRADRMESEEARR